MFDNNNISIYSILPQTIMGCGASDISGMECEYELQTCTGHEAGINCMALADDESLLVTGSEDKTARLWTTKTKNCECIGVLRVSQRDKPARLRTNKTKKCECIGAKPAQGCARP